MKCTWEAYVNAGNYLLGVGVGNKEAILTGIYHKYSYWAAYMKYNAHNQFLDTLLSTGLIGLGCLVFWFIQLLLYGFKTNNKYLVNFIMLISICSLTESTLERMKGVAFVILFTAVLAQKNSVK